MPLSADAPSADVLARPATQSDRCGEAKESGCHCPILSFSGEWEWQAAWVLQSPALALFIPHKNNCLDSLNPLDSASLLVL